MSSDPLKAASLIRSQIAASIEISREALALARAFRATDDHLITRSKEAIDRSRGVLADRPPSEARRRQFADLKLADAHVRQARHHIERQRALVRRLSRQGIPTEMAECILENLQTTLSLMESHRVLIRNLLGGPSVADRE